MPLTEEQKALLKLRAKGFKDERERRAFIQYSLGQLISQLITNVTMTVLVIIGIIYLVRFILLIKPLVEGSSDPFYTAYPVIIFLAAAGSFYLCIRRTLRSINILRRYVREKKSG